LGTSRLSPVFPVFRATGEGDGDYTNRRSIEAMAGCGVDYVGSLRKGSAEKDNTGTTDANFLPPSCRLNPQRLNRNPNASSRSKSRLHFPQ